MSKPESSTSGDTFLTTAKVNWNDILRDWSPEADQSKFPGAGDYLWACGSRWDADVMWTLLREAAFRAPEMAVLPAQRMIHVGPWRLHVRTIDSEYAAHLLAGIPLRGLEFRGPVPTRARRYLQSLFRWK